MWQWLCNRLGRLTMQQTLVVRDHYPRQFKAYLHGILTERDLVKFLRNCPMWEVTEQIRKLIQLGWIPSEDAVNGVACFIWYGPNGREIVSKAVNDDWNNGPEIPTELLDLCKS